MEDQQIIQLYWERSQTAIVETDSKYGRKLTSISTNILHDLEDAKECVNDTYHATWNNVPPERPNHFFAYLARITRNFSLTRYDYKNAGKRKATVVELSEELENCIPAPDDMERRMDSQAIGAVISRFLEEQSKEMRVVFVRRYWYMDSVKDIARNNHMTEGKVKSILFRMRNKLRDYLAEEGVVV